MSRVASILKTAVGLNGAEIRDCRRRRRNEADVRASRERGVAGGRRGVENKVRGLIWDRDCMGCWRGKARRLGLRKPCLLIIRDERL